MKSTNSRHGGPPLSRHWTLASAARALVTSLSRVHPRSPPANPVPVTLVAILFFLWGFAYGLLDVLNSRFQVALHITQGQSSGLQGAYFG